MKIINILGSPRYQGNSTTIARRFCDHAAGRGAVVETVYLNKLNYQGCQACMVCKTRLDHCALNDDLTLVLNDVAAADVIVLATPVYYGDMSSQMKGFIDRTFSYMKPDYETNPQPCRLPSGKTLVFISTQADPDETHYADIFPRYQTFFKWYGFKATHNLRGCGLGAPDAVQGHSNILVRAEQLAEEITGSI